jgi:phosphoglycolate phosphatase-like HAD superfamily hydrolase
MPGADIRTILFDLDGTLLDTAPDLAAALNKVLEENQQPALPFDPPGGISRW